MSAGFTPGPWFAQRSGFSTVYIEARIGGGMLQEVAACGPTQEGSEQQDANARLIAAAPDLLEIVGRLMRVVEAGIPDLEDVDCYQMAKDLLNKIDGSAS